MVYVVFQHFLEFPEPDAGITRYILKVGLPETSWMLPDSSGFLRSSRRPLARRRMVENVPVKDHEKDHEGCRRSLDGGAEGIRCGRGGW